MSESALLERDLGDGVRELRLNRPERRNALDADQWERLAERLSALAAGGAVSCLVLTGAGTAFASGGDIARFLEEVRGPGGPERFRRRIHLCLGALYDFPAPTVARINGPAIGGGMEIAVACDVRVASTRARLALPAARFGIVMALADFDRLAALVGPGRARWITMTSQPLTAEEAQRIGLVDRVVDPEDLDAATMEVARGLASTDRQSALWFREAAAAGPRDQESVARLQRFETECLTGSSFRRRVAAFLDRSDG